MPEGPCTILGGLPVIAEVWFTRGDGWMTDDDAGVDALFWQKRDGSKGKEVSQKIYDRLEKSDPYWQCGVTEQVFDYLAYTADNQDDDQVDAMVPFAPPVPDEKDRPAP